MLQVAIQALFSQPTNWYSAARISYVQIFFHSFIQSFAHVFDKCMNDWRIESIPIVQAIFIISLTNNNANNNNIVNEHQNR